MFRTALRFLAGAAVATAIWWYATPAYNQWLSTASLVALQWDERLAGAVIEPRDRAISVRSGTSTPSIEVPADQLTYNIVLFAGLLVAAPPRRLWRTIVALAVLLAFHIVAVVMTIEATYAMQGGDWSTAHYSSIARDFWHSVDFIYRLGGMFAVAFVCWYAATWSRAREPQQESSRKSARGERRRPRTAASHR
jgi:hypothetical protein